jgi:hypothetical protein
MALYDPAPQHWLSARQALAASAHYGIEPEQVSNYVLLADYLTTLPADYKDFDMESYMQVPGEPWTAGSAKTIAAAGCGTVACAIGHGPTAGIPAMPFEDWGFYTPRVFGGVLSLMTTSEARDRLVTWCFDSVWTYMDNTHWGAAARIRTALLDPTVLDKCVEMCGLHSHNDLPDQYQQEQEPELCQLFTGLYAQQLAAVHAVAQTA